MEPFAIVAFVLIAYVNIFNEIAKIYFDSGRTMTWFDFYRYFVPSLEIRLAL
jgi:hypothetical protein